MCVLYIIQLIYYMTNRYRSPRSQTYGARTESPPSNLLLPGRCWGGFNCSLESRHSTFPPE